MERLVFNTAEHKLEELEKYGFKPKYWEDNGNLRLYYKDYFEFDTYNENWLCQIIIDNFTADKILKTDRIRRLSKKELKQERKRIKSFVGEYADEINLIFILYDLIKDGLVIKEKQNDKNNLL